MSSVSKHKSKTTKADTDFSEEIKQKQKAFVLFYASWCPFSQRFLPVFQEYAKSNPKECISVVIDDKPNLCEEYEIEYYPTILLFRNGAVHKRLDAEPGIGLNKKQLEELTKTS
jgi:thiol-disulfide isomerase/thioredoxin